MEADSSAAATFTALAADLKTSIKNTDKLKDAIAAEMGSAVVLDKAAYEVLSTVRGWVIVEPSVNTPGRPKIRY